MTHILLYNIKWDTDQEGTKLPTEEKVIKDDFNAEEEGADYLSDKYGWLVESFAFKTVIEPNVQQLGYYAKDKSNNLFQFRWHETELSGQKSTFQIFFNDKWVNADENAYEILEIGFFKG